MRFARIRLCLTQDRDAEVAAALFVIDLPDLSGSQRLAAAKPLPPRSPAPSASPAPAQTKASVSASSVPEWKRRDFAPTQPMADDEEDSLYMPLSETQLGRLD